MLDLVKHNLMVYMYSEDCRLENDMVQLLNNVSYRKADQLDMLEMIMAKTRLEYALADHRKNLPYIAEFQGIGYTESASCGEKVSTKQNGTSFCVVLSPSYSIS